MDFILQISRRRKITEIVKMTFAIPKETIAPVKNM